MNKHMFPMDGVVTDIQSHYRKNASEDAFEAKTTFILSGKELILTTFDQKYINSPHFIVPSHLVLAVERQDDKSLEVTTCYIRNKKILVDFDESGTLISSLGMAIIFISVFIMTVINLEDFILGFEFIVGSIALLLCLASLYWGGWTFLRHSKGRRIIAYRLHRIIQLENRGRLTPFISTVK